MIALLTNIGANVNSTNLAGITPLHLAARGGDESVVTCLLSLGAKINAQNHSGITPVLEAAHYRNTQIVKLLILRSASVTIFVRGHVTVLGALEQAGYGEAIQQWLLIARQNQLRTFLLGTLRRQQQSATNNDDRSHSTANKCLVSVLPVDLLGLVASHVVRP
eukprot:c16542_g1_i3.p1 GENE.c16542_g1_i3~~c16542_g1_i3.p1  ORF type:complete len:163 (-),score=30.64 c16542_g1_i3:63-551(-)